MEPLQISPVSQNSIVTSKKNKVVTRLQEKIKSIAMAIFKFFAHAYHAIKEKFIGIKVQNQQKKIISEEIAKPIPKSDYSPIKST